MNYFLAVIAGAIQGLTEFLPVSSTGHLIIFEHIFNISQDQFGLTFDASLRLGTLCAVVLFFYKDYLKVLNLKNDLLVKLAIGTIPTALFGLLFEKKIETSVRELWIIGVAMIAFSLVMLLAEKVGRKNQEHKPSIKDSFVIGLAQSIALIPGISRSGSTISAGLFLGLKREEAARFAFMLSGPIIAGAGSKKFLEVLTSQGLSSGELTFFLVGIISSATFGYLTIKYFLKYISSHTLYPFIAYRIVLGTVLIISALHF